MPLCAEHNLIIGPNRWCYQCNDYVAERPTIGETERSQKKKAERQLALSLLLAQVIGIIFIYSGLM